MSIHTQHCILKGLCHGIEMKYFDEKFRYLQ
jgi:hypothetical protein